jgi:hypothetical protein
MLAAPAEIGVLDPTLRPRPPQDLLKQHDRAEVGCRRLLGTGLGIGRQLPQTACISLRL